MKSRKDSIMNGRKDAFAMCISHSPQYRLWRKKQEKKKKAITAAMSMLAVFAVLFGIFASVVLVCAGLEVAAAIFGGDAVFFGELVVIMLAAVIAAMIMRRKNK